MTQTGNVSGPRVELGFTSSPFEPSAPAITDVNRINLIDRDMYQCGDPHAAWKLLREQAPVFWNEEGSEGTENRGFWAVTRYADAQRVLRESATFSSTRSAFLDVTAQMIGEDAMLCLDPPRQRQLRKVTQHLFSKRHMDAWEQELIDIADTLIDDVIETGESEFFNDIAIKFPIYASCALLGVSQKDAEEVQIVATKLHATSSPDALAEFSEVGMGLFTRLMEERRDDPGPGIVGAVLGGQTDGEPLTDSEILAYLWLLFVGGLDSTTHAMTNSLAAMFHHPEQVKLLQDDANPGIWDTAVEECLRWTSISQHLKRYVLQDTEIAGQKIPKGDYVAIFQPSMNRDAAVFPHPFRFDLTRQNASPIATFGGGPHMCLGLHYARLELKVLFRQVMTRMPDIAPAGPMERGRGYTVLVSPIHRQPVVFTPGPRVRS